MSGAERPLQGRHAVVTGASRGIGAAIARTLAGQGAVLSLLGRREDRLRQLAAELPGGPHAFAVADVSQPDEVQAAFVAAREALGPVRLLINNAGQAESAAFPATSLALWQRMLEVNLTATFLCTQAALPDMQAASAGRIVNIASTAAQRGYAYVCAYAAAKHGVLGLTRSLALELARTGITVNAVCPGYTDTDLLAGSVDRLVQRTGRSAQEARRWFAAANPQQRLVQAHEVADAVQWLCSDAASAVTGQAISVSGGEVT